MRISFSVDLFNTRKFVALIFSNTKVSGFYLLSDRDVRTIGSTSMLVHRYTSQRVFAVSTVNVCNEQATRFLIMLTMFIFLGALFLSI